LSASAELLVIPAMCADHLWLDWWKKC